MYIPTWIIVIAIIVYLIYRNNRNKQENQLAITGDDDFPALTKFSLRRQHEEDMRTLDLQQAKVILDKHLEKTSKLKNEPNKVKSQREKLDEELKLSQRMWQFIDDVKYYPSWRKNQKNDDGSPWWRSKAIAPEQLVLKKYSSSTLKKLIDKKDRFKDSDEILEYSFDVDGKKYLFLANRSFLHEDNHLSSDADWLYYYPVYIFTDDKLVFQVELYYESDGDLDYYRRNYLEAFKPGKWTIDLLEKIHKIRQEEEEYSKKFWEKFNKEREEENKKKFVD